MTAFDPETFVAKVCGMFRQFEEGWLDEFEDAECELLCAAGALEQLRERLKSVRTGECDSEREVDLFEMREHRIAESEDRRAS